MSSPIAYLNGGTHPIPLLPGTVFTFGRGRQNSVYLNDAMVSRQHAVVSCEDSGDILLIDLGSSNHTHVNNEAIEPKVKVKLKHKDQVRMGGTVFNLEMTAAAGVGKSVVTELLDFGSPEDGPGGTQILTPAIAKKVNEKHNKELLQSIEKASEQQLKMLPKLPTIPKMEFQVLYRPLGKVSGDFYDFFKVPGGRLALVIGDVSGHGVEAALSVAMVKKTLKIHGRRLETALETLQVTNADIQEDLGRGTFCSIFYGLLDTDTLKLTFARAGHSPLIIFNANRTPTLSVFEPKGLALGIDKGTIFNRVLEEMVIQLQEGDMLVQFTDGLMETANKKGEQFGMKRICEAIKQNAGGEAQALIDILDKNLNDHRGSTPIDDDLTIVCVKMCS